MCAVELQDRPKASRIRALRLEAGLTQSEAAAIVWASLRTWQNWEAGKHAMNAVVWNFFREVVEKDRKLVKPGRA